MVKDSRLWPDYRSSLSAREGKISLAYARAIAGTGLDFQAENMLAETSDELCSICDTLEPLKLAVLSSGTQDHFLPILQFRLMLAGYRADIFTPSFDTVTQNIRDPNSTLYGSEPDVIWVMNTFRDVVGEIDTSGDAGSVSARIESLLDDVAHLKQRSNALLIVNNIDDPPELGLGNFEATASTGRAGAIRSFNQQLSQSLPEGVICLDFAGLANHFGLERWHDRRFWYHSKHHFSFDAYGPLAHRFSRLVSGARGRSAKCLVLDLDNTLWGGVIGDDGVEGIELGDGADGEAFKAFQAYAKNLSKKGILLAVCSKNESDTAKIPFQNHPDMQISLDDIACFRANWTNKAANLKDIAESLNIRADALVFVDDNPVERDLVRKLMPDVWVPELPEDPAHYISAVDNGRFFETTHFSHEDADRARLYRENSKRQEHKDSFGDIDTYLASLDMTAQVDGIEGIPFKRSVQLINKSNQFNLTGARISEAEASLRISDAHSIERTFRLKDKFGDNGLICVVLGKKEDDTLHIDTWVMSCRVLERGMELFVMKEMTQTALEMGCSNVSGIYKDSGRNGLVAGLYQRLGFEKKSENGTESIWVSQAKPDDFNSKIAEVK